MSEGNHSPGSSSSCPESLHTNYGPQCTAHAIGIWLECLDVMTRDIQPGSPWGNGSNERSISKLRDGGLTGELCYMLQEVQILVERGPQTDHGNSPHSAPLYRPPAPEGIRSPSMTKTTAPSRDILCMRVCPWRRKQDGGTRGENMRCARCQGLMMSQTYEDLEDDTSQISISAWRCFNCGEVVDPRILKNRLSRPKPIVGRARLNTASIKT